MAIAADLTQGCNDSFRSGNQEFYIQEACNVTAATASGSDHSFTSITTSGDWFKFEGHRNTMDWNAEGGDNGSFTVTANITFEGNEKDKIKKIQDVINARKVCVIAVSNESAGTNPRAFLLGYDNLVGNQAYLEVKAAGKIEASAFEGVNDITLTFTGTQLEYPREVVADINYNSGTVTLGS
jgi:hypothetical protein